MLAPHRTSGCSIAENQDESAQRVHARPTPSFGFESIRRHKRVVGLSGVLGLLIGVLYAELKPTTCTASIELLVYNRQIITGPGALIQPGSVDSSLVQNEIELLRSRAVLARVIEALNLTSDPEFFSRAAIILQPLRDLISSRSAQVLDDKTLPFVLTLESLRRKLKVRRVGASHVVEMRFTASKPEKAVRIANEVARTYLQERTRLMHEAPPLRELYQGLGPSAHIISEAERPSRPDGPSALMILLGATLFALGGGVIVAVMRDVLNNTIRDPDQLEYFLGLQCLGVISRYDSNNQASRHGISAASPALRRVIAAIERPCSHRLRSLGVTSAMPGEGTSTIALNLARIMALSGSRVCLIGPRTTSPADRLAEEAGQSPVGSDEHRVTFDAKLDEESGLHVLSFGEGPDRDRFSVWPAPLDEIARKALESYEFVIVDMPCLASGADVRAAAHALNGFLLVVKWGGTDCELIRQAFRSAGEAQRKFVGAVLNMADQQTVNRYGDKPGDN